MDADIRYRRACRYVMFDQIAELRALKRHGYFPWSHAALCIDVCSRLNALGGLAGEW
ncbi:hypothetical protein X979_5783 [Burkholderia pseudomallei MSHR7527]|nr:hypothetical protein DP46_6039 [Burkholderia phage BEK]KGS70832.1 hypothetical protein X979_5783 [Burkholderia pseudomallei MSHR7527]KGX47438.1 hypothetical protein Y043_6096 [Burkholderia pseudomallei MSHR2138]